MCRSSAGTDDALEAFVPRQAEQDARVVHVVLYNEKDRIAFVYDIPVVLDGFFECDRKYHEFARQRRPQGGSFWSRDLRAFSSRELHREKQGKGASLVGGARELYFTAKQRGQFAADRQTEAGAAISPRSARVGLLEGFEDKSLLLRRDADARILDSEGNDFVRLAEHRVVGCPSSRRQFDADLHVTVCGEFDGV